MITPRAYLGPSIRLPAQASRLGQARASASGRETFLARGPAVRVVTDFAWEEPATVAKSRAIGRALPELMPAGVRAQLVVDDDAYRELFLGLH